jgi:hypothetical protein
MNTILSRLLQEHGTMASDPTPIKPAMHHGRMVWQTRWYGDVPDRKGKRRRFTKRFGEVAAVPEKVARQAYKLWKAKWNGSEREKNPVRTEAGYTCTDLAVDYVAWARTRFVKHGR